MRIVGVVVHVHRAIRRVDFLIHRLISPGRLLVSAKGEVPTEHLPKVHRIRAIDKRIDTGIGDGKHEEGVFQIFLHVVHLLLVEVKEQNNGRIRRPTSDVGLKQIQSC